MSTILSVRKIVKDGIEAQRATVVLGLNPALAGTAMLAGTRTGIPQFAIFEQFPGFDQIGTAILSGSLLTLPPAFVGGYVDFVYRSQWATSNNTAHELTVDSELGVDLTDLPPDAGTVLVSIRTIDPSLSGPASDEFSIVQLHSETVLAGLTITARVVLTSTAVTTLTPIPNTFHGAWQRRFGTLADPADLSPSAAFMAGPEVSGELTLSEYQEQTRAAGETAWNSAHEKHSTRCNYAGCIKQSGIWIAVVPRWAPSLIASYEGRPIAQSELSAMDGLDSPRNFQDWWSTLLARRNGSAPSDLIASVVANDRLLTAIDGYAAPMS